MAKKKASKKKAIKKAAPSTETTPPPEASGIQQPGMQQPGMQQPGVMQPGMMQPGMMQPGMMQPGMMQPGMMPPGMVQPGGQPNVGMTMMPGMMGMGFGNPMAQMLQMLGMQAGMGQVDASAMPFVGDEAEERGLEADIVQPALVEDLLRCQEALSIQPVLDRLCLSEDGKHALGGIPVGCTVAFAGPPGKGKTRSMLEGVARVAAGGMKCAYVVAEEGFRDEANPGRDDLCSRFAKIAMFATGLDEAGLREQVLPNVLIILSQYHKGHTWDDFIRRYKHVVEEEGVRFVVVDSLNTLDPSRTRTAENLATLKTYNHENGVTCVTIGQIKDSGEPVGGESLMHTADAVFLLEEMSLGSKDMAEFWGGKYREKVTVIRVRKSVTTPIFPFPVRVRVNDAGQLEVHPGHPADYALLPVAD
jgi:KaiC/GvpD/RAD55 family RecA-like ATPase